MTQFQRLGAATGWEETGRPSFCPSPKDFPLHRRSFSLKGELRCIIQKDVTLIGGNRMSGMEQALCAHVPERRRERAGFFCSFEAFL